jgi:hypothetical protein
MLGQTRSREFWWGEQVDKLKNREEDDIKTFLSEAHFEPRRRTEDHSLVQWMSLTSQGQLTVAISLQVSVKFDAP